MSTTNSRDGFATHVERAEADRLPLPFVGRVGFCGAVLTLGFVLAALWPWRADAGLAFFLLYGAGHVVGWWFARPRRGAGGYTRLAALLLVQQVIYMVFWGQWVLRGRAGLAAMDADLSNPVLISFFVLGPALGLVSGAVARGGWVFCFAQWGGPVLLITLP